MHGSSTHEAEIFGEPGRNRYIGGAGIKQEYSRRTVQGSRGNIVTQRILPQANLSCAAGERVGAELGVGIVLFFEKAREQHGHRADDGYPAHDDHHATDAALAFYGSLFWWSGHWHKVTSGGNNGDFHARRWSSTIAAQSRHKHDTLTAKEAPGMDTQSESPFVLDESADWFANARVLRSPNCDERPLAAPVDLAIVHGISLPPGQFGSAQISALFLNQLNWDDDPFYKTIKGLRVSSHLLIERSGALLQFVPLSQRAWHAGQSRFAGRERCNDFSIGIELEGSDYVPYTAAQYHALGAVLRTLMARYPRITTDSIVGHCHVAPGRKTDPGASFNWSCLGRMLGAPAGWEPNCEM